MPIVCLLLKSNKDTFFVDIFNLFKMVRFLQIALLLVWIWMLYIVISTSMESSLFEQWNFLASIPWMRATLWDFYANILIIFLFVLWREKSLFIKFLWAVLFFFLGSIGSIAYVLIQLFSLKEGQALTDIFKSKSASR